MLPDNEEVLKTLVSDTRREIIKVLSDGEKTPTDLSKILKKSKSTIIEHLEKLVEAGLVDKIERPGHKWVFYTLTRKGEFYISKNSQKIIIILSFVFLSIIGGFLSLLKYLSSANPANLVVRGDSSLITETYQKVGKNAIDSTTPAVNLWPLYISIAFFIIALGGIFYLILSKKRMVIEI